ncbi:MAG TPA: hypothetical protein PK344_17870 [Syntrophorhabdaceae bacterium]|nr:hypothetical protein [Syntrophorhabdaceae bacterium]
MNRAEARGLEQDGSRGERVPHMQLLPFASHDLPTGVFLISSLIISQAQATSRKLVAASLLALKVFLHPSLSIRADDGRGPEPNAGCKNFRRDNPEG